MAERARIAPDSLPGTTLPTAQLFSLKLAHHARAPGYPSSPSSHERVHWSIVHSHTNAVPAYHATGRYRPATHYLIGEWSSDDYGTEHVVGRADITPGAGVNWVGCRVDDHLLSVVVGVGECGRSADDIFGDGALVDRCIGAVGYVLYNIK